MKGGRHHRERAFKIAARQLRETAPVRKARRMHDRIDAAEFLAGRADAVPDLARSPVE